VWLTDLAKNKTIYGLASIIENIKRH